jgi:hypothetical protein
MVDICLHRFYFNQLIRYKSAQSIKIIKSVNPFKSHHPCLIKHIPPNYAGGMRGGTFIFLYSGFSVQTLLHRQVTT